MIPLIDYLILSAVLFTIGIVGILIRRNIITIFMSIEIVLNSVNLSFVAFSRYLGNVDGQIVVFFILAVVVAWFKLKESIQGDDMKLLKG